MRFILLCVCLMACAIFGRTFGQENDFRETSVDDYVSSLADDSQSSVEKRDLPFNPETVKPCIDSVGFAKQQRISNIYKAPLSISAADYNNDNNDDVVVAYSTSNAVVLYTRSGTNWNVNNLGSVAGASAVFSADFNGDGRVDIAAASQADNMVYWFKNTPNGWVKYEVGTANSPVSIFAGDINGDLRTDIIVGGDGVTWFLNNIDNAVPNSWAANTVAGVGSVDSVSAADINKDGFLDIVIASSSDNEVSWLNNTAGDGTAFSKIVIADPEDPIEVFVTDIDNDGWQDVMTTNYQDNSTTLYFNSIGVNHTVPASNNNSASTVSNEWVGIYVAQNQNGPMSLFATDINGDGGQEIVVALNGANQVNYYKASGDNYTWSSFLIGNFTEPTSVFARDIDGDNAKDVVVASASNNTVGWFEELCATSPPGGGDDDHVLGWSLVGGIIGGLLILWILIAILIAIADYIKYQSNKAYERAKKQNKKEAAAILPSEEL